MTHKAPVFARHANGGFALLRKADARGEKRCKMDCSHWASLLPRMKVLSTCRVVHCHKILQGQECNSVYSNAIMHSTPNILLILGPGSPVTAVRSVAGAE